MARVKGRGLKNLKDMDKEDKTALDERTFEDWIKLTDSPVSYLRVSTTKQEGTLPTQQKDVSDKAKKLGLKRIKYFQEQASGKNNPFRPELLKMIEYALDQKSKGKTPIVLMRDIQRFSRDAYDLGIIYKATPTYENSLWSNDIPLVSLNERQVTGTKNFKSLSGDFLAPLFINLGGQEVATRSKQTRAAVKAARDKGILAGTPINLYYKEPLNPLRELERLLKVDGLSNRAIATKVGRSPSWVRDTKFKFSEIRNKHPEGEKGFQDWLDVGDMVRMMEKEFGPRTGSGSTKRMIAVGRMTSGYFARPWEFDTPTQENLDFYFNNFKDFQPKRR
jgi:DNA invertase Pin-like site-specific DNA recombinase